MKNETGYIRPEDLAEAIKALDKMEGKVAIVCGGAFDRSALEGADTLLDLQNVSVEHEVSEAQVVLGPNATLSDLLAAFEDGETVKDAFAAEAGLNVRNTLSLYNFFQVADGRSSVLALLRAMDAELVWQPGGQVISLERYLENRHVDRPGFWSKLSFNKPECIVFESVARTPVDKPIVALAVARDSDGKLRVATGGVTALTKVLQLSEGADGREKVAQAFAQVEDTWASAQYRQHVATVLFERLIERINHCDGGAK